MQFIKKITLLFTLILMIGAVNFTVAEASFSDVTSYETEIDYLTEKGIIQGYNDGTFRPENNITRVQSARMLTRELQPNLQQKEELSFKDIQETHADFETIQTVVTLGLFGGKERADGTYFDPSGNLTRAQLAKVFVEAYDLYNEHNESQQFKDVPDNAWYKDYLDILYSHGIITGYSDGTFRPNEPIKRKHFSAIYYRYLTNAELVHREIYIHGTAKNNNNELVRNQELDFVSDEEVIYTAKTDANGQFEVRVPSDRKYVVKSDAVNGSIYIQTAQDITSEFTNGTLEFGTTLTNGENFAVLSPNTQLISNADEVIELAEDFTSVILSDTKEYKPGDLILIESHPSAPNGVALRVTKVIEQNGQYYLETEQPKIEEIYVQIKGSFEGSINQEDIVLDEDASFGETPAVAVAALNNQFAATTGAIKPITIKFEKFPYKSVDIKPSVTFGAQVKVDVDWALEWDLMDSLNAEFTSYFEAKAEVTPRKDDDNKPLVCKEPLKKIHDECVRPLMAKEVTIATSIPGVTVAALPYVAFDFKNSVSATASFKSNFIAGVRYDDDNGVTTYPDDKFTSTIGITKISGSTKADFKAGVNIELEGAKATIINSQIFGGLSFEAKAAASAGVSGSGISGEVCASLSGKPFFGGNMGVPLVKYSKPIFTIDIGIGNLFNIPVGKCLSDIVASPDAIQLKPGESKNIIIGAIENGETKNLLASANPADVELTSSNNSVATSTHGPRYITITAPTTATDGATAVIEIAYPGPFNTLKDEIEVEIFDPTKRGELVGSVIDAISNKPISNATVKAYQNGELVTKVSTNEEGQYSIQLAKGLYDLEISKLLYKKDTSTIEILEAQRTQYDSTLKLILEGLLEDGTAQGKVINSLTGQGIPYIPIQIFEGRNVKEGGKLVTTVNTDRDGNYKVTLEPGQYTIVVKSDLYNEARENIISIPGKVTANQNITASPIRTMAGDDLEIILTWGAEPSDLDSHFKGVTAYGEDFHVYYRNKYHQSITGMKIELDVDDMDQYGPETVTVINNLDAGEYEYYVHNYSGDPDIKTSGAVVRVYQGQQLVRLYNVPLNGEGLNWRVFKIINGQIVDFNYLD